MEEVKKRIKVAAHFIKSPSNAIFYHTAIESAALQIRKILERIAFGSLIANRDIYEKTYKNFSTTWKASILLKDLARINPHYYPVPITPNPQRNEDGILLHSIIQDGYLKPEDFQDAYETCNGLLHATNPYKSEKNMQELALKLANWIKLIVQLLNTHEIHFIDMSSMWVINMQEDGDDRVHFYEFEQVDSKNSGNVT